MAMFRAARGELRIGDPGVQHDQFDGAADAEYFLLSFAQFEREVISERTRDKLGAARRKGKWIGGILILGYDVDAGGGRLVVNRRRRNE
jgi:DNA invertase Pin-like site-specific DNA recombinase